MHKSKQRVTSRCKVKSVRKPKSTKRSKKRSTRRLSKISRKRTAKVCGQKKKTECHLPECQWARRIGCRHVRDLPTPKPVTVDTDLDQLRMAVDEALRRQRAIDQTEVEEKDESGLKTPTRRRSLAEPELPSWLEYEQQRGQDEL